jgi:hypothetical protein
VAVRHRNVASNRIVPFVAAMLVAGTVVSSTAATASASAASRPAVTAVKSSLGDTGRTAGGATVTVSGTNLTKVMSVRFGTNKARDVRVSRSGRQLTAVTPTHAAGTVNVTVTTADGTSRAVTADRFTYVAAPVLTSLSVANGPTAGGTVVTVTGRNFADLTQVDFGSTAGRGIRVVSSSRITVTSPPHVTGLVDVRVVSAYGTSSYSDADRFTFASATPTSTLAWHALHPIDGHGTPTNIDCVYSTFCVETDSAGWAVVSQGNALVADDVSGPNPLTGVSCLSPTDCMAVDGVGNAYSYDGTTWSGPTVVAPGLAFTSISCSQNPEPVGGDTTCAAVTSDGDAAILTSAEEPSAGGGSSNIMSSWTEPESIDPGHALTSVSCPGTPVALLTTTPGPGGGMSTSAPQTCVAVGSDGDAAVLTGTWTNNEDEQKSFTSSWTAPSAIDTAAALTSVSCPTPTSCTAVDKSGDSVTWHGAEWSAPTVELTGTALASVSCPGSATAVCSAVGGGYAVRFSPGAGPSAISKLATTALVAVSCPTSANCTTVDDQGSRSVDFVTVTGGACTLVGPPGDPAPDDGYGFLGVQSDGQPARWDPCNIIYYAVIDDPSVVNQQYFDGGSVNYITDLANVIQQTEAATGLEFQQVTNGSDEPDGSYSDPSLVPSQAVFQVSWVNFQNTSGGVQADGETSTTFSASYSNGVSHVQAIIGANTKMSYTLTPGFPPEGSNDTTDGSVLLHEFGHVVGLQDLCAGGSSCPADATSQIDYVTGNSDSTFQNGDLNGLYLLSSAQGDTGY